jgi:hypothetical protein
VVDADRVTDLLFGDVVLLAKSLEELREVLVGVGLSVLHEARFPHRFYFLQAKVEARRKDMRRATYLSRAVCAAI